MRMCRDMVGGYEWASLQLICEIAGLAMEQASNQLDSNTEWQQVAACTVYVPPAGSLLVHQWMWVWMAFEEIR